MNKNDNNNKNINKEYYKINLESFASSISFRKTPQEIKLNKKN